MKIINNSNGASIKELVMVIIIIVGLGFISIPAFFALREYKINQEFYEIVSEIENYLEKNTSDHLDQEAYPFLCKKCFDQVFKPNGIESKYWTKLDLHRYQFKKENIAYVIEINFDSKEVIVTELNEL